MLHVHKITLNANFQLVSARLDIHLAKEKAENLKCPKTPKSILS